MESKWISVHDKMPNTRRKVLCFADGEMTIFTNKCGTWDIDNEDLRFPINKITHWCEIPDFENRTIELQGLFKHKVSKLEAIIRKHIQEFENENEVCIEKSELIRIDYCSTIPKSQLVRVKLIFSI